MWQPSCLNFKGVRREKIRIVTTMLPKMGKERERERERERENCGNQVAKNLGKNLMVI